MTEFNFRSEAQKAHREFHGDPLSIEDLIKHYGYIFHDVHDIDIGAFISDVRALCTNAGYFKEIYQMGRKHGFDNAIDYVLGVIKSHPGNGSRESLRNKIQELKKKKP